MSVKPPLLNNGRRRRPRVLFFSEAVTLAHVARPVMLAQSLDPSEFEVHLACADRYLGLFGNPGFPVRPISSIPSEEFLRRMTKALPLFSADMYRSYVREDIDVIQEIDPDVVIGDLRLSLAVSAQVTRKPYLALVNAYWSPYARPRFVIPDLSWTRYVGGVACANVLFGLVRPIAFAMHTFPLNQVRREYGLPSLGFDLRQIYTHADHTLYADVPQLVPCDGMPATHHFLGPIVWSPAIPLPNWWARVPETKPVVYVTLGSSGPTRLLDLVAQALSTLPVTAIVATAGRSALAETPHNVFVADYLPGTEASKRADLVICNGGSPTTHQALATGTPVLGLPSNMDQFLNMDAIQRTGVGVSVRAGSATVAGIRSAAKQILDGKSFSSAAQDLAAAFASYDALLGFKRIVGELLPPDAYTNQAGVD